VEFLSFFSGLLCAQMMKFEAEKFCARVKLQFGMAPDLVETFLKNAAECPGYFHLSHIPMSQFSVTTY